MNYDDKTKHNLKIVLVWVITQRVITQKSTSLSYFAVATWNHA